MRRGLCFDLGDSYRDGVGVSHLGNAVGHGDSGRGGASSYAGQHRRVRVVELGSSLRRSGERDLTHVGDVGEITGNIVLGDKLGGLAACHGNTCASTDKIDALDGTGGSAGDELINDVAVVRHGVACADIGADFISGQAVAGQVNRTRSGLVDGVGQRAGEEVVGDVVVADLEEGRVLRITAAILGVDVDRKVDADDLRLEQRGNCELQGRAVARNTSRSRCCRKQR